MSIPSSVREQLGDDWIPAIYSSKIRALRTRAYEIDVPQRENEVEILFTLLGIEIKVGKKRFACPDLATARYLKTFARVGCRTFAVPYDITKIGPLADELELSWHRSLLLLEKESKGYSPRARSQFRAVLLRDMRAQIDRSGPGDTMPEFKQSTKQRIDR